LPKTPRTPRPPDHRDALDALALDESQADDGALHRFYEWLELARTRVDLDALDLVAFRALVRRFDRGGDPP